MTEIVSTDGVLGGDPRLDGRRISVLQIADMVIDADRSPASVADQLDVSLAEFHAALSYYDDNPEEIDAVRDRHDRLEATIADEAVSPDHVEQ